MPVTHAPHLHAERKPASQRARVLGLAHGQGLRVLASLPPRAQLNYRVLRHRMSGEPELQLLPELLREPGIVLDVGANSGPYSAYAALLGRFPVAFEPLPEVAAKLRSDLGHWVKVEEVAASDRSGRAEIEVPVQGATRVTTRASLEGGSPGEPVEKLSVRTERIDAYGFTNVRLLKIDVEGHEMPVLTGAVETIERERPTLIIEIEESRTPGGLLAVRSFLEDFGYSGWFLQNGRRTSVSLFDASRLQRDENRPLWGEGRRAKPQWVNNFIWTT